MRTLEPAWRLRRPVEEVTLILEPAWRRRRPVEETTTILEPAWRLRRPVEEVMLILEPAWRPRRPVEMTVVQVRARDLRAAAQLSLGQPHHRRERFRADRPRLLAGSTVAVLQHREGSSQFLLKRGGGPAEEDGARRFRLFLSLGIGV